MPAVEGLLDLVLYALLFLALAWAYLGKKLTQALFGPLLSVINFLHIPYLSGVVQSIDQSIVHFFGTAEAKIDTAIGASWHWQARLMDELWGQIKKHASTILAVATPVGALFTLYHWLKHSVHDLTRGAHSIGRRIARFERELHGIEHGVRTFERDFSKVLHHDVLPRIRSLDKELTHVETQVIPNIRSIAQGAETDVTSLRKWIARNVPLIGTTALVGAVAWALSALGLGWTRCANNGNLGKTLCGLENGLFNDMLGALFAAAAIADFRELVKVAQTVEHEAAAGVKDLLQV